MPRKKDSVARHNKSDKILGVRPPPARMNSLLAPPEAALSQGRQFFGRMMGLGDLPPLYPICNDTHLSILVWPLGVTRPQIPEEAALTVL